MAQPSTDPGCENYQAWQFQVNPRTDDIGKNNHYFPEYNATYWGTAFDLSPGTVVTIKGQYPRSRYMSFQVYVSSLGAVDGINDMQINPDPGQNNPFRTGSAQGTYTVRLVFGRSPDLGAPPNTVYTAGLTKVTLLYRVYYPDDPNNLPGGPLTPTLPDVIVNGQTWTSCPLRPILPEESTLTGRLDNIDFVGAPPPIKPPFPFPVFWQFWGTSPVLPFFPSDDSSYMSAVIARDLLEPPFSPYDLVVIRMKAPTFANTQAGVPPYAPANVRYWSICVNEFITTAVVRCVPDNQAATLNGYATFVISDPSKRPSDAVLTRWGAKWIPWGALMPNDVIYSTNGTALTNSSGVFYYGIILYRQVVPDPNFAESIENVSELPILQRRSAMGEYFPDIGYCRSLVFQLVGPACVRN